MAHIRTAKLVCDKCGRELDIDPSVDTPFGSSFAHKESNYADWGEVKGRHFCPDCYAAYRDVVARHDAELSELFGLQS